MRDDSILSYGLREEILSSFEGHLRAQGSLNLDSAGAYKQILDQARLVLDEVVDTCRRITENVEVGVGQAIERVHPADSLRAASVLFQTALPHVLRAFSAPGRSDAQAGAVLVLHRVIMSRIASSGVSHSRFKHQAIRDSHRAELARLARDLHDRTAHAIGVAIQNLELHDVHADRDVERALEKLQRAREAMQQALDSVRHISAELHTTVRPDELEQALTDYLAANAECNILTSINVTGETMRLPREVCGEIYVTLREAIRNALMHSGTTRLDVTVGISESQLLARVSDTGRGFSVEEVTGAGKGIGLSSMRERVHLLGGTLRLSSLLGHGTTVEIAVPLGWIVL